VHRAIDDVGAEETAEEQDLSHQEGPDPQLAGVELVVFVLEVVGEEGLVAVSVSFRHW
jgi:hypothetical protein